MEFEISKLDPRVIRRVLVGAAIVLVIFLLSRCNNYEVMKADQVAVHLCRHGGVGKVGALQQVTVDGVLVQRLALADQFVNPATVLAFRFTKGDVIRFVGG